MSASVSGSGFFAVKVVVIIIIKKVPTALLPICSANCEWKRPGGRSFLWNKKIRRVLNNDRAEANYFSAVLFIFIAVLLLAFIMNLFSIISAKQELDLCADQMVKQIQLSGGINSETNQLFNFLSSEIKGAENISYNIDASYKSPTPSGMYSAIQLGSPFYITIQGDAKLGGFWNLNLIRITIVSKAAGVSEHYWK